MTIGEYKLHSIITSAFKLDGGAMFGIIPKPLWEKKSPADSLNRISMVTRSLLLVSGDRKILIDTGNGTKWTQKQRNIYDFQYDNQNVETSLEKLGYSKEDITDVWCTHLHFDHVGGNTELIGKKIVPAFPNATYWIHKDNWDLANAPSEKDRGSFMSQDWSVLAANQMIQLVGGGSTFLPGIDVVLSHGHTLGQMLPRISDGNRTLLYCGDLIPMASHISLPWVMAYDIQPVVTIQEKKSVLQRAVDEEWILFFEHDPLIELSTVEKTDKGFAQGETVNIS